MRPLSDPQQRLLFRHPRVQRFEAAIARRCPVHPNVVSALKLGVTAVMVPALVWSPPLSVALFLLFALLDYLDGVVARGRSLETSFGRVWDRVTDVPMLLILGGFCVELIPLWLVLVKVLVDVLLMGMYVAGWGSTENRIRTTMSYAALAALLLLTHGWSVTPSFVHLVLATNIVFTMLVGFYNVATRLRVFSRKRIADVLSAANLACGIAVMSFAAAGHLHIAVLCLLGSVLFDGLDGAAARRWGGSRFGVLADDLADGLSYGVAPGYAIAVTLPGLSGTLIGIAYALLVASRLVFFTFNKVENDPAHFRGAPSTLGAIVTLCSLHLFGHDPLTVGILVGGAIVLMVSFDVRYRHLGRAMAQRTQLLRWIPVVLMALLGVSFVAGVDGPIAVLLVVALGYGMRPTVRRFTDVVRRGAAR